MNRKRMGAKLALVVGVVSLVLTACSAPTAPGATSGPVAGAPDWCGSTKISLGLLDGFGGNSWRLVTTAAGAAEAAKCPSVTGYEYADGQGDTQKSIADIQGMVAKGVKAIVVFPDAGEAMLPALRSAFKEGVVTVPYRVFPGGKDGVDYSLWVGNNSYADGEKWANWVKAQFPDGANVLFVSGPKGNSQGEAESKALHKVLADPKYTFIGEQPFEVTGWDPAVTQKVLTAAIAKYPKIDVIVSDFGPSLVGALPEFPKSGRSIPAIATSDGNVLGCFFQDNSAANKDFKLMTIGTGNDNVRLAVQQAVALATGGKVPAAKIFESQPFEDSISGTPNKVKCERDLPGDVYLSAEMSGKDQSALLK